METYANLNGNSGVSMYEIHDTSIKIKFKTSVPIYVYTYIRPGQSHVESMKQLAKSGNGLNSYIKTRVNKNFDHKE